MSKLVKYLGGSMSGKFRLEHAPKETYTVESEVYVRWRDHPAARDLPHAETDHHETYVLLGMSKREIEALVLGGTIALTTRPGDKPRS